nr:hypothetical protein CFP56_11097 [Quercus suber]
MSLLRRHLLRRILALSGTRPEYRHGTFERCYNRTYFGSVDTTRDIFHGPTWSSTFAYGWSMNGAGLLDREYHDAICLAAGQCVGTLLAWDAYISNAPHARCPTSKGCMARLARTLSRRRRAERHVVSHWGRQRRSTRGILQLLVQLTALVWTSSPTSADFAMSISEPSMEQNEGYCDDDRKQYN